MIGLGMERNVAILVGRYPLTETSLIVHWWAAEAGLIKTVAKGALRPKSAFNGRLDLFVTSDIRWVRSRTGDLHTLTEAALLQPRLGLRQSYQRLLAATYLVKLVEMLVEREAPVDGLDDLLTKALDYLTTRDPMRALVERFELRLAQLLGVGGAAGHPAAALQSLVHGTLPVQRSQLWQHFDKAEGK